MDNQCIIAHRGESFDAPENTLSSINRAWNNGIDAVEIDVRLTKDNRVVVIHDPHTFRVARKLKWIRNSTLLDLKKVDVGKFKNNKYKGEKIPELSEVLRTVPVGKKIIIEIKSSSKIIPFINLAIVNSGLQADQIEIISFNLKTLIKAKKQMPNISFLWILELDYFWISKILTPSFETIISTAIQNELNGLNLFAGTLLNAEIIKRIKSANLRLYAWTVNNPEKAKKLLGFGVDAIITDRAKWMKNKLSI
ncbi:MAG: hypothetical protein A2W99_00295 [Bacteroidetes bacterium GWF2_33_16]|nr:MAG: hypothetical protein A2X00_03000 [Bacteroidetes bacterium GWE2_32_14]OFY08713.1 MAG: hypothetical protein A2W99_00295 [Bacteroidetes bacterium GWF2_33_16]